MYTTLIAIQERNRVTFFRNWHGHGCLVRTMKRVKSSYSSYMVGKTKCKAQVDAVGYGLTELKKSSGGSGHPRTGSELAPVKKTRTSSTVTPVSPAKQTSPGDRRLQGKLKQQYTAAGT